jgi:Xaa-Pro aminopeptidase
MSAWSAETTRSRPDDDPMMTPAAPTNPETDRAGELRSKLATMRSLLESNGLAALRLRGHDWFAWATGGASNSVLWTSELGIAELLITETGAFALADAIDAPRLEQEELPDGFEVIELPWAEPDRRDRFVADQIDGGAVASDAPVGSERMLPEALHVARLRLCPGELDRYHLLGREAAEAMTETLVSATPGATEWEIAAAGADALLRRGIHPALVLVGGSGRLALFRHPTPTTDPLGDRAMVVFCGRRHGLYANLTRFVYFRPPTLEERRLLSVVAEVEAVAWNASCPGTALGEVYDAIAAAYSRLGFPGAELEHHQGGVTGYRSREVLATPSSSWTIQLGSAVAWNPSLAGSKVEDTAVVTADGLETLTLDRSWPVVTVDGRRRPDVLVIG